MQASKRKEGKTRDVHSQFFQRWYCLSRVVALLSVVLGASNVIMILDIARVEAMDVDGHFSSMMSNLVLTTK